MSIFTGRTHAVIIKSTLKKDNMFTCVQTCGNQTGMILGAQWHSALIETEGPRVRASSAPLRCGP